MSGATLWRCKRCGKFLLYKPIANLVCEPCWINDGEYAVEWESVEANPLGTAARLRRLEEELDAQKRLNTALRLGGGATAMRMANKALADIERLHAEALKEAGR